MDSRSKHIYQTGERVAQTGEYEMIMGTGQLNRNPIHRDLKTGEVFPCHDGFEVCWHLITCMPPTDIQADDRNSTPLKSVNHH